MTREERIIYHREYYKANKEHYQKTHKRYYEAHKKEIAAKRKKRPAGSGKEYYETHKDRSKNDHLKNQYGITLEKFNEMNAKQKGLCAICGKLCKTGKRLCVDHDHETGEVRGLLCQECNCGLGLLKDNVSILEKCIKYLTRRLL